VIRKIIPALRPADSLNLIFLMFLASVTVIFHRKIGSPSTLVLVYSTLVLFQTILIRLKDRNGFFRICYDLIFPTISILVIFDSLEQLVHYLNPGDIDPLLIRLDYMIFKGYPTVMMEKIMTPLLTDILQVAYSSYYFLPVTLGIVLKLKKRDAAFDRSLFFIMLCFYLSYLGYMLMPAIGPRFTMNHLQNSELQGLFLAHPIQELLNRLEGIKRDAFPSGHTGIALTVLYLAFKFEKRLFCIYSPFVIALVFSTVYCRYHYVVDVIAGVFLTLLTIVLGEIYYGYRSREIRPDPQ
jgi:membrane-associated phospholipid phosphatase